MKLYTRGTEQQSYPLKGQKRRRSGRHPQSGVDSVFSLDSRWASAGRPVEERGGGPHVDQRTCCKDWCQCDWKFTSRTSDEEKCLGFFSLRGFFYNCGHFVMKSSSHHFFFYLSQWNSHNLPNRPCCPHSCAVHIRNLPRHDDSGTTFGGGDGVTCSSSPGSSRCCSLRQTRSLVVQRARFAHTCTEKR